MISRRTLVGRPETPEDIVMLAERSPLNAAERITRPLLMAQGANDPRVPGSESEQMVAARRRHGIPVNYALFLDEEHGATREPNRLVFNAEMEAFLAKYLGGRLEAFTLSDLQGNSMILDERSEQLSVQARRSRAADRAASQPCTAEADVRPAWPLRNNHPLGCERPLP